MKELYLLSGLGADKRVFDFVDLSDYKVYHIEWVAPLDGESMEGYAKRLLPQIKAPRPILIGVSFGGMMTVEIAKLIDVEKAIVISSAKTNSDIPFYYRVIGQLGLNKLIPTGFLKSVNGLTFWLFGTKTQKEKDMLRAIIKGTDDKFLKWAVEMPDVDFRGMHPGVSEVINAMEETPKAAVLYLNYGLSFEYRRLSLVARLQESSSTSFLNDLKVGERLHPFRFKTRYLNFTLSYKFYSLRKRQERA